MLKYLTYSLSLFIHFGVAFALTSYVNQPAIKHEKQKPIIVSLVAMPEEKMAQPEKAEDPKPAKPIGQKPSLRQKTEIAEIKNKPEQIIARLEDNQTEDLDLDNNYSSSRYKIGSSNNPIPRYPNQALRKKQQGKVVICVDVSNDGVANEASICSSSGHTILDVAALKTIKKWKFQSASAEIETLSTLIEVPIIFSLKDA